MQINLAREAYNVFWLSLFYHVTMTNMVEEVKSLTDLLLEVPTHLCTVPSLEDLYGTELHILRLERDLLNLLIQRFQNVNEEVLEDLNNLKTQVVSLLNRLENVLVGNSDDINSSNVGRPRLTVSRENIIFLFNLYKNWKIVSFILGMSERTIRRLEYGLNISRRQGSRSTYSDVSQERIIGAMREILQLMPDAGERIVIGGLRGRGIFVQRERRATINGSGSLWTFIKKTCHSCQKSLQCQASKQVVVKLCFRYHNTV